MRDGSSPPDFLAFTLCSHPFTFTPSPTLFNKASNLPGCSPLVHDTTSHTTQHYCICVSSHTLPQPRRLRRSLLPFLLCSAPFCSGPVLAHSTSPPLTKLTLYLGANRRICHLPPHSVNMILRASESNNMGRGAYDTTGTPKPPPPPPKRR
ncbi:uncharacterized protein BDR25DRAFT_41356 [Lindgomyces ingoldianus]|uniref:Uncharacterized protein n=1 Tax=Lindgomyces ingoldianus TaxID=673940 RepID=A0ACB6RBX4_9PLEO|nr:uncharacterized protein BDR25DRAFT_41356 [Lindgomyces ingoldianus]KAF2476823.1 hypothetical protein BDR25DRAFT_41356 [Lindgomyces ingoldianus]